MPYHPCQPTAHPAHRLKRLARALAVAMALTTAGALAGAQAAQASASSPATAGQTASSKSKSKTSKAAKVRVLKDNRESASERTQRLRRECKGRPNAGACQGHAS